MTNWCMIPYSLGSKRQLAFIYLHLWVVRLDVFLDLPQFVSGRLVLIAQHVELLLQVLLILLQMRHHRPLRLQLNLQLLPPTQLNVHLGRETPHLEGRRAWYEYSKKYFHSIIVCHFNWAISFCVIATYAGQVISLHFALGYAYLFHLIRELDAEWGDLLLQQVHIHFILAFLYV